MYINKRKKEKKKKDLLHSIIYHIISGWINIKFVLNYKPFHSQDQVISLNRYRINNKTIIIYDKTKQEKKISNNL